MNKSEVGLFNFELGDKVLFVGEGNFSFSQSLLKYLKKESDTAKFHSFCVTCYQSELSSTAYVNASYLKSLGAEVLLDIDATKLETYEGINTIKFNNIVFNFPHVGGKMKIHLNRDLLRRFFISASAVLAPLGKVIVSLCSGQGGTGFDHVNRRWDDSWQVVEQAASSGFILSQIEFFPHQLFPDYKPVGYRGRDQVFSTDSAVVHSFCKAVPIVTYLCPSYLNDLKKFHHVNEDLLVASIHKFAIDNSPFSNPNSPQNFLFKILQNSMQVVSSRLGTTYDLPYNVTFNEFQAPCLYKGENCSLRSDLLQVIQDSILEHESFLFCGLIFKKPSSDFSDFCAKCHCVVKCSHDTVKYFFSELVSFFKFSGKYFEIKGYNFEWDFYFQNEIFGKSKVAWGNIKTNVLTFDLDLICSYIFGVSVRQLWCPGLKFDVEKCGLILPSLYPLTFVHDVSFASKTSLNLDEFYYLLHQMPNTIIELVSLVSTYYLKDSKENSYCFRLTYRSYDKPLNRKLAIEYHENVVGKSLENGLHVRIR